jgi:glutathione S-transferase
MKLYNAPMPAPNPRRVRIFLAEKGQTIPMAEVAIMKREHKSPEHLARNSLGQVPTLELDDGTTISETVAICRYLETVYPKPPLFGRNGLEQALVEMWTRRIEFTVMTPVGMFWRHAHPFTAAVVVPQYKEFGESNREHYNRALGWLDRELEGKHFLLGEEYTMADICLLSTVDFASWIGLTLPDGLENVRSWHKRVSERPSAAA